MQTPIFLAQSSGILTYFNQSNFAGKIIVLALLVFSFAAWTIMIGKYLELSRLRTLNLALEQKLSQSIRILNIDTRNWKPSMGPYARLIATAIQAFQASNSSRIEPIENAIQRMINEVCIQYESKMVLLSSIVSGAPFLGLLGTVWGVMDSFGMMESQSSATLQSLAPGVSGALLTTVAGLLVAIPAVFGYNYLLTQTKLMVTELENFASSLADRIDNEFESQTADSGYSHPSTVRQ